MPTTFLKYENVKNTKKFRASVSNLNNLRPNSMIFGFHAIHESLKLPVSRITEIWLSDRCQGSRVLALIKSARGHGIHLNRVSKGKLDKIVSNVRHQGVVAYCKPLHILDRFDLFSLLNKLNEPPFLLILDCIQDPHNLGACIRTAEAAGVHAVIAPKNGASGITPAVLKVSSGSAERLPFIQVSNLAHLLRELRQNGVWLVGTSGKCDNTLFDINLKGALAVVLGAESRGIRPLTRKYCDQVVYIPMRGGCESLNVSVAAGVCLFEARRQRNL